MYNNGKTYFDRIIKIILNPTCLYMRKPIHILDLNHNKTKKIKYTIMTYQH